MKTRRSTAAATHAYAGLALVLGCVLFADQAAAEPPRPYAVLVNGYTDCCIQHMSRVISYLHSVQTELVITAYDQFADGSKQRSLTSSDEDFLSRAAPALNALAANRPLILIGHSFGGDSLIKLLPRLTRSVQLVAMLDPTATGGLRAGVVVQPVPRSVQYLYNRWQKNPLGSIYNMFPFDNRVVDGTFRLCGPPTICDQDDQNLRRRADGSDIRERCEFYELCHDKAVRMVHADMPADEFIQQQIIQLIAKALTHSE